MPPTTDERVRWQIKIAAEERAKERARLVERLAALRATVLDRSLDLEARLAAHMAIDSLVWARRRGAIERATDPELDKIALSKRRSEVERQRRKREARTAAGLPVRKARECPNAPVVNELPGPQNCPTIGSLDQPATSVPQNQTLASGHYNGVPEGSRSRDRDEGPAETGESHITV